MTDAHLLVRYFHEAYGLPVVSHPSIPSAERVALRLRLIDEEYQEVRSELTNILEKQRYGHEIGGAQQRLADLAKELSDLIYVIYGCALEFGLPLNEAFAEVHRSNMSKLGEDGKPIRREDGKILKGPHYREADILGILGVADSTAEEDA